MQNPWLNLPLDDYEQHMGSPAVQQLGTLSDLFGVALAERQPASVAILGVAGGNGLELIDTHITKRIVGIDLNPLYLDAVRRRYSRLPGLELACHDLERQFTSVETVELVHAALIFEHTGLARCLENAASLVSDTGALSVVLQLPSETAPAVSESSVPSIQRLSSHFSLVDKQLLGKKLATLRFRLVREFNRRLPAGKAFWMGIFTR